MDDRNTTDWITDWLGLYILNDFSRFEYQSLRTYEYVYTAWYKIFCYIPRLSLNKTSTVICWFLVTCLWWNSSVSRPNTSAQLLPARRRQQHVFAIWLRAVASMRQDHFGPRLTSWRKMPRKVLKRAFQSLEISKYSGGGACPHTLLSALETCLVLFLSLATALRLLKDRSNNKALNASLTLA